jgi:hypothetical protein
MAKVLLGTRVSRLLRTPEPRALGLELTVAGGAAVRHRNYSRFATVRRTPGARHVFTINAPIVQVLQHPPLQLAMAGFGAR